MASIAADHVVDRTVATEPKESVALFLLTDLSTLEASNRRSPGEIRARQQRSFAEVDWWQEQDRN